MGHECSTFVLRGCGDAGRDGASPAVDFHAFCDPADTAKEVRRHYSGGGARPLKFVFATEPPHRQWTVNEFRSLTEAGFHYTAANHDPVLEVAEVLFRDFDPEPRGRTTATVAETREPEQIRG